MLNLVGSKCISLRARTDICFALMERAQLQLNQPTMLRWALSSSLLGLKLRLHERTILMIVLIANVDLLTISYECYFLFKHTFFL